MRRYHGCVTDSERIAEINSQTTALGLMTTLNSMRDEVVGIDGVKARLAALRVHAETVFAGLDAVERDALRFIAGSKRVWMPNPETVDRLRGFEAIEPHAGGVSVGMVDDYRLTELGSELLTLIGVRG